MTTGGSLSQAQSTQKVSRRPRWFALFFELSDPAWFQAGGIALALVMLGALGLLGWGLWHHPRDAAMTDIDCPDCGGIHAPNSRDCPGDREAPDEEERQAHREAQAGAEPDALSSRGWALWREPRG